MGGAGGECAASTARSFVKLIVESLERMFALLLNRQKPILERVQRLIAKLT